MDVSIVILSYNTKDLLKNCLESVFKFTKDVEFEVIVVDNASTDGSVEYLQDLSGKRKAESGKMKIILSKENLGFSRGNNLGIEEAKGKYVLLLNSDTVLVENSVGRMFLWMEGHKDVAVASCQLTNSGGKISPTGGYFPTLPRVFAWAFFLDDIPFLPFYLSSYHPHSVSPVHYRLAANRYVNEFYPDWVTGAFFMIRREAMEKVGTLDGNFFMYGEELEWCMRFKKALRPDSGQAGWKVGYTPITKIVHLERGSQEGVPKGAILGEFRGLKYIYGKHFPGWKQVLLGTLLDVAAFNRVIFWLVQGKMEMVKVYLEALLI